MDPHTLRRRGKIGLITAFVSFLFMVGLQSVWNFLPDANPLYGSVAPPAAPVWSWAEVGSGRAFRAVDACYANRIGWRSLLVRLDNQIHLSVFGELAPRLGGTRVVGGRDGWLFEAPYLRHSITPGSLSDVELRERAARFRSVQDKLGRRGLPFLLIVAPSKAEIFPERVPPGYFSVARPGSVLTDFEKARPFLREAGVNLLDASALFSRWKQEGRPHLFPATGTHWSYLSCYHLWEDIRGSLNPLLKHPLPEIPTPTMLLEPPRGIWDADLYYTSNLLHFHPQGEIQPRPVFRAQISTPVERLPRLLWVNDSFGSILIEQCEAAKLTGPSASLYYFRKCSLLPGNVKTGLDLKTVRWENFLPSYDAVIMVCSEVAWDMEGWGFLRSVDGQLP